MRRTFTMRAGMVGIVLALSLAGVGCNQNEGDTQSSTMLTIEQMLATMSDGSQGSYCASDVITIDAQGNATIIEDIGQATIRNALINPDQTSPSPWQDIVLTRYRIRYTRADGRNREGEDVPYAFEASMNLNLRVGTSTALSYILVRATAKTELPLVRLAEGPINEDQILTTATVEFLGHDLSGHPVSTTGYIAVHFANWADQ